MTEETKEEAEPPDLRQESDLKNFMQRIYPNAADYERINSPEFLYALNFKLNGRGSQWRAFRTAEAEHDGVKYIAKLAEDGLTRLFVESGTGYICLGCNNQTERTMVSREITSPGANPQRLVETVFYCSHKTCPCYEKKPQYNAKKILLSAFLAH